eukprot:SM000097S24784  [mRNA]  locus=s97:258114:258630:+ [translate_table: standard]
MAALAPLVAGTLPMVAWRLATPTAASLGYVERRWRSAQAAVAGFADDPVVNKYATMGLRMEAVVLAVATYGDVQNKVVDFCSAYGQLTEMGFSSEAVAGALAMYDNDRERALAQLAP